MQHCAQRYVLIVTNNHAKVLKKVGNTTNGYMILSKSPLTAVAIREKEQKS